MTLEEIGAKKERFINNDTHDFYHIWEIPHFYWVVMMVPELKRRLIPEYEEMSLNEFKNLVLEVREEINNFDEQQIC